MKKLRILYAVPAFYALNVMIYANDYIFNGESIGFDRSYFLGAMLITTLMIIPAVETVIRNK